MNTQKETNFWWRDCPIGVRARVERANYWVNPNWMIRAGANPVPEGWSLRIVDKTSAHRRPLSTILHKHMEKNLLFSMISSNCKLLWVIIIWFPGINPHQLFSPSHVPSVTPTHRVWSDRRACECPPVPRSSSDRTERRHFEDSSLTLTSHHISLNNTGKELIEHFQVISEKECWTKSVSSWKYEPNSNRSWPSSFHPSPHPHPHCFYPSSLSSSLEMDQLSATVSLFCFFRTTIITAVHLL